MRSILLYFLAIPIPIILLLAMITACSLARATEGLTKSVVRSVFRESGWRGKYYIPNESTGG
jgi:hypothetical protein